MSDCPKNDPCTFLGPTIHKNPRTLLLKVLDLQWTRPNESGLTQGDATGSSYYQPKQGTLKGKPLRITVDLHCLIPPNWGGFTQCNPYQRGAAWCSLQRHTSQYASQTHEMIVKEVQFRNALSPMSQLSKFKAIEPFAFSTFFPSRIRPRRLAPKMSPVSGEGERPRNLPVCVAESPRVMLARAVQFRTTLSRMCVIDFFGQSRSLFGRVV